MREKTQDATIDEDEHEHKNVDVELLTRIESGRVDSCGIDGRTLSAVRLGGIHSGGRRCDVARQAAEETWRKLCLQSDVS